MNAYEQGLALYAMPKDPNDIDLVQVVRTIMVQDGMKEEVEAYFDTNPIIMEAVGKASPVQRHQLNRYFRFQMMSTSVDSTLARTYLIENGTMEEWLMLFQEYILPFIRSNNLPKYIEY